MGNIQKILAEALALVKPTKEEEGKVAVKIGTMLQKIRSGLRGSRCIIGGSGAKGTWLRDVHDADIFVLFGYKKYMEKSDALADILEKHLKKRFSIKRLHGSRDYFQIKKGDFTFEVIPILEIKKASEAKNITDVSPLHTRWVLKHKNLADDMRLLKQFCKSARIYGAESYINGFSGYICEILIANYKGFMSTLKAAANWPEKAVIDVEAHYKGKDILHEMNKSKTDGPLVVVDPVQKERNAAAALSCKNFSIFKQKCVAFLQKPSLEFFTLKTFSVDEIEKRHRGKKVLLIAIKPLKGKSDIIGCKMVKAIEFIAKQLRKNGFTIIEQELEWDKKGKAMAYFILSSKDLSKMLKWEGPPLKARFHAEKFKQKYRKTFVERGRICTLIKRRFIEPEGLIKALLKDSYVRERVKSIQCKLLS